MAMHDYHSALFTSRTDLSEDVSILRSLVLQSINKLSGFERLLNRHAYHLPVSTDAIAHQETSNMASKYVSLEKQLKMLATDIGTITSVESLASAAQKKNEIFFTIRSLQAILGSLLVMTDWQSPSFLHSLASQAGVQTGKIIGTINDYKRDQHLDAQSYEDAFRKEYFDALIKFPIAVYATSSGMAAFTTILMYLLSQNKINGPVILGKSSYFEYKELVRKIIKQKIIEVDDMDTSEILSTIKTEKPSILFFDTLCNAADIAMPDLPTILTALRKTATRPTYAVIDNTGLATTFQPLHYQGRHVHIIGHESLNKYHQFGMDRVTGGVMYGYGLSIGGLFTMREHAGTNISDASVCALPAPDKKMLLSRLNRLQRNATALASHIQSLVDTHPKSVIERVLYPGLPMHPSYPSTKRYRFTGSFFSLAFKPRYRSIWQYKRFVARVISQARRLNVNIVSGTSFGLPTTRIYLTAIHTDYTQPFVRIAVGTEHLMQIEKIKELFTHILT